MLRAIIGTVAVLAGFSVVQHAVEAGGDADFCGLSASLALLPGEGVVVRDRPAPEAAALGSIAAGPAEAARPVVTVTGRHGGWARLDLGTASGFTAAPGSRPDSGWIPAERLRPGGRTAEPLVLRAFPGRCRTLAWPGGVT
ncbi:hypothetical protein [Reyranella sp.]|uniref:hypothetical protein n=1 Tax=Reyranella sp. TaxID=1929291 RepID=UPI003BA97938